MVTLRQAAQQALEALGQDNPAGRTATINALQKALAEPHDPVAYDGWVLREVLFDNGEPVGHRAPDRHALQAEGKHPAPCARHCEAKAFEIEIRMLKAALAEPEQEPVFDCPRCGHCCPQRKPLSDEEIEQAYRHIWRNLPDDFDHTSMGWIEQGVRYAEQAHGIKGKA